ncbi:MAG: hypothetical protein ACRDAM_04695, partial [Casimicrobium sp.]
GPVIVTIPFKTNCTKTTSSLICIAKDVLKLGAGVTPVYNNSLRTTGISIHGSVPSILFDWNGDGEQTADAEGLLLIRFLAGFRGSALVKNVPLAAGKTEDDIEQAIIMGWYNGWYDFTGDITKTPLATREGLIFSRCLGGKSGNALTAGLLPLTTAIEQKCNELRTPR